nr:receptor-like protein EIX1 [Coffea arabica]
MEGKFIQFFSLICLCLFPAISTLEANDVKANKGCIEIERKALIKFKEGLTDPSHFLSSWTGDNCCSWKGISCSNETGHVVKIELQNYECFNDAGNYYGSNQNASCLGGQISTSLLDLKYLDHLDLSLNSFQIPIPEFLGSLGMLSYLNLSLAAFTGMIPQHLGNLSNLRYLDLSSILPCSLMICIGSLNLPQSLHTVNFTSLSVLELTGNRFKSPIPRWFSNLSTLVQLDLTMSEITGDVSAVIGDLTTCCKNSLEELILAAWLKTQKQLSTVILTNVGISELLELLDLGGNRFAGKIPKWLGASPLALFELRLRANRFSGSIPEEVCNLIYLHILDIAANYLSGSIPACLGQLTHMQIVLPFVPISPISAFKDIAEMDLVVKGRQMRYGKTLELVNILDLSSNNLSGEIPKEITRLLALGTLNLSRNQLTANIPEEIGNLSLLETLDLSHNHLSGPIPRSMTAMTFLNYLNLSYNNLSGQIPSTNQFQTFNDPSIYEGNAGLCGVPLPTKCDAVNAGDAEDKGRMKDHSVEEDGEDSTKLEFYISMVLGFILDFGVCLVVCTYISRGDKANCSLLIK